MEWILANGSTLLEILNYVVIIAGLVAAITPTQNDDGVVDRIKNLLGKFRKTPTP